MLASLTEYLFLLDSTVRLLLLLPGLLLASVPHVATLRWMSPDSSRPGTYQEYRSGLPAAQALNIQRLRQTGNLFDRRVDILVQDSLIGALSPLLDTLLADLAAEGYQAVLFSASGNSPESLRTFLQDELDSGLVAATLVGSLPVAWFQMIDDWNNNRRRDPDEHYEEFPCDLFLMDLDGTWEDRSVRYDTLDSLTAGQDGIYDLHYGSIEPEIGISRLHVSTVGRADSLLRLYLARCHRWRRGNLPVTDRALVYIDDDWLNGAPEWDAEVGMLYPLRVSIWDEETTRVADYRPRIDTAAYQWIALCAHSWPGGHAMKYSGGTRWDWFYANTIPALNPEACFYNLFACSNVRFTENGYCGGMYVFRTATGLAAIGSTKTGSMLEFQDFYLPLADGLPMALAFRDWFYWRAVDGIEPWERSWFYGMTLAGDGMLKPRVPASIQEEQNLVASPLSAARIVKGVVYIGSPVPSSPCWLFDKTGRALRQLHAGLNNLSVLSAGIYFIRRTIGEQTRSSPLIITK